MLKSKKKGKAWLPDGRAFLNPRFIQAWRRVTQPSHRQQSDERVTALGGAGSFVTKPSLSGCQSIYLSEPFSMARYFPGLHGPFKACCCLEDRAVPCGTLVRSLKRLQVYRFLTPMPFLFHSKSSLSDVRTEPHTHKARSWITVYSICQRRLLRSREGGATDTSRPRSRSTQGQVF